MTALRDDGIVVVMTTDQYLGTPETAQPHELVYGVLRDAPAPTPRHQDIVGNIYSCLRAHLRETGSGKAWLSAIDVILDRERALVVQPDVIVVMNDRLHIVTDRVWGAPDLVVEVLSPKPRIGTLDERIAWFAQYGVRECWLVHQLSTQVEVISFAAGRVSETRVFQAGDRVISGLLPGLAITARLVVEGY